MKYFAVLVMLYLHVHSHDAEWLYHIPLVRLVSCEGIHYDKRPMIYPCDECYEEKLFSGLNK